MIGIIFLAIIGLWIWADVRITRWLLRRVSSRILHHFLAIIVFVTLLVLPVADEIIGGFQLRALCEKNAVLNVNAAKIIGKEVRVSTDPANNVVGGTMVRILYSRSSYRDADTNEELASYGYYVANGGWLIRTLSTDKYVTPLTFPSSCSGGSRLTDYKFILIK